MLNLLLALLLGVIIGWSFHAFFNELGTPNIIRNDFNITDKNLKNIPLLEVETQKNKIVEQNISKQKIQNSIKKKETVDNFYTLLDKGLFSDAMALYLEATEKELISYRLRLLDYFREKVKIDTNMATTQMYEFIELEPEHEEVAKILMETLYSSNNYHEFVSFLEEQISRSSTPSLYIYRLAEYYVEIENYFKAIELLKEIVTDEDFGERAQVLLDKIDRKSKENREYSYRIPLKKSGDHFTVDIYLNDTPLTLLLDTGATLTMINEERLPPLTLLKDSITLQTVGGEVNAQLKEAEKLSIGELELKEFKVVSSYFQQKDADGLLGMNFFKRFKFKIDQESKILYLSWK